MITNQTVIIENEIANKLKVNNSGIIDKNTINVSKKIAKMCNSFFEEKKFDYSGWSIEKVWLEDYLFNQFISILFINESESKKFKLQFGKNNYINAIDFPKNNTKKQNKKRHKFPFKNKVKEVFDKMKIKFAECILEDDFDPEFNVE